MDRVIAKGEEHLAVPERGMSAYRAHSMTQPHKARQALRDAYEGKIDPLICYYCGVGSVPTARIIAQMGADMVWIDWEHASMGVETMTSIVHIIQFMSEGRTIPFVRIPGHDHASIGFALDAGASLIIPQVDTVEQAREICAASKFGKQVGGTRSAPPFRWMAGLGDTPIDPSKTLWQNFNDQAALVIQIESQTGLDNLDAILTECGQHIDGVWLGLMDFRASLGLDGMWGSEPEYVEGVKRYEEILRKHDKPNTGVCLTDFSKGGNKAFVVVGGDGFTFSGEKAMLATARKNLPRLQYVKEVRNEI